LPFAVETDPGNANELMHFVEIEAYALFAEAKPQSRRAL
jgi:hypothetical protein